MTSQQYGWKQSDLLSQLNRAKANGWLEFFRKASTRYSIPLSILLAIASRETNMRNIKGDGGHGRGLMQIDDRYHSKFIKENQEGLDPESNIDYAANLLRFNMNMVNEKLGGLVPNLWKPAISGYNGSLTKVIKVSRAGQDSDSVTTGKNYAADVLSRSEVFDKLLTRG